MQIVRVYKDLTWSSPSMTETFDELDEPSLKSLAVRPV
jgi:hypothetical protein